MIAYDLATRLIERVAASYGLPFDIIAADYDGTMGINYAKLAKAGFLINDAIHNKHWGHRGWKRKLKRARRLQIEATGAASDFWFRYRIETAEERQIEYRAAVMNAVLTAYIDTGAPA